MIHGHSLAKFDLVCPIWLPLFIFLNVITSFAYIPSCSLRQDSNPQPLGCILVIMKLDKWFFSAAGARQGDDGFEGEGRDRRDDARDEGAVRRLRESHRRQAADLGGVGTIPRLRGKARQTDMLGL